MKKILITGGASFIGTEIVKQLADAGDFETTVLDALTQIHGVNYENSYLYKSVKEKCNFIKADVRDFEKVQESLVGIEYIIHLVAETGTGQSMYQINQYNEVNIMGLSNILQAISILGKDSQVKKIILSSSRSVYGEGKYNCHRCGIVYPDSRKIEQMKTGDFNLYCDKCGSNLQVMPTTEDSIINPKSLYAFTKYTQEKMLETMCPALGIEYTIFRFQNVYGVGESLMNPYTGILSVFSSLLLENKDINIFEDGKESRDFINVIDVASAVTKSLYIPQSNSEIINLGSGIGTSVIEIAEFLKHTYASYSVITVTGDFRIGDIAHNIADISKAKEILGFDQRIPLTKGLNEFCKWVIDQKVDNSGYVKSLDELQNAGMFVRKNRVID